MSADGAFDLGIANNVMIFAGTVISWVGESQLVSDSDLSILQVR